MSRSMLISSLLVASGCTVVVSLDGLTGDRDAAVEGGVDGGRDSASGDSRLDSVIDVDGDAGTADAPNDAPVRPDGGPFCPFAPLPNLFCQDFDNVSPDASVSSFQLINNPLAGQHIARVESSLLAPTQPNLFHIKYQGSGNANISIARTVATLKGLTLTAKIKIGTTTNKTSAEIVRINFGVDRIAIRSNSFVSPLASQPKPTLAVLPQDEFFTLRLTLTLPPEIRNGTDAGSAQARLFVQANNITAIDEMIPAKTFTSGPSEIVFGPGATMLSDNAEIWLDDLLAVEVP